MLAITIYLSIFAVIIIAAVAYYHLLKFKRPLDRERRRHAAGLRREQECRDRENSFMESERQRIDGLRLRLLRRIEKCGAEARLAAAVKDLAMLANAIEATRANLPPVRAYDLLGKALNRVLELGHRVEETLVFHEHVLFRDEELTSFVAQARAMLPEPDADPMNGFRALPALLESIENRRRAALVLLRSADSAGAVRALIEIEAANDTMMRVGEHLSLPAPPSANG
ncbi:hypothetical protein HY633_02100 [Candidatus Uhrbacteria bacterium]|nr:hypothetical protein [Candidatus Uhrbacteria bacterium]